MTHHSARPSATASPKHARPIVRPSEFRRFLRQVGLGALVPGAGLIAAGRHRVGWLVLLVFALSSTGVVFYGSRIGRAGLVRLWSDADRLGAVGIALVGVAGVWLLVAVVGLYLLQPAGLRPPQRLLSAFVVVVVASVAVTPLSIASRYAFVQVDLIRSVFADEDKQHSLTIPDKATDEDPWAGQPRVNVLILGADSGAGRDGTRTDTVMVASIDTDTGSTALFSLPRNLQYTPMPKGPLHDAYPHGYHGEPEARYWLSAMYRYVPEEFPDYFHGIADPGAEALKLVVGEALGLDISYYVMVNLRGFQSLVDALGGVDLDVPYRIPTGTQLLPSGRCSQESSWIEAGDNQHLDGYQALWFARARCGPGPISNDYERMRRQRCLIGAIASQADPFSLVTRYQQLASAAKDTMSTDIPRGRLDDFAELALKVKEAGIRSLPFTNEIIDYYDPDYQLIRQFVHDSLHPSASPTDGGAAASASPSAGDSLPEPSPDTHAATPQTDASPTEATEGESHDEAQGAQAINAVC
jgi:LCP family protein required for cell wall assembly